MIFCCYMICTNCNKEILDGTTTCVFCGNKVLNTKTVSEPVIPVPQPNIENVIAPEKKIKKSWIKWIFIFIIVIIISTLIVVIMVTKAFSSEVTNPTNNFVDNAKEIFLPPADEENQNRDLRVRNDTGEILNALERYNAAKSIYPWQSSTDSSKDLSVQLNNANWMELLFSSGELPERFREKLAKSEDVYTVYSNNEKLFVCFNPKSKKMIKEAQDRCVTDSVIEDTTLCTKGSELSCIPF